MMGIIEDDKESYENENNVVKCRFLILSILDGIILLKNVDELIKIIKILEKENKKLDTLSKIEVIGSILNSLKYFEKRYHYEILWRLLHIINKINSQPLEILEDFVVDSNQTKITEEEILRRILFTIEKCKKYWKMILFPLTCKTELDLRK